jgi:5-formyltetrahydrofolate cyclo-ligase
MNDFPVSENRKSLLRKESLAIRQRLPLSDLSRAVRDSLEGWTVFRDSETVLCYCPFRGEIDLMPLMPAFPEKAWALPKVQPNGALLFHAYTPKDTLSAGKYGIMEPENTIALEPLPLSSTLILLPGLSFDRRGYRLGYGKGYYDRYLAQLQPPHPNILTVGVIPDALLADTLPTDPWDMPVNYIATEQAILKIQG